MVFLRVLEKIFEMTAFTAIFQCINSCSGPKERGAINGLSMMLASVTKAVGPLAGAELFAYSVRRDRKPPYSAAFPFILCAVSWFLLGSATLLCRHRLIKADTR